MNIKITFKHLEHTPSLDLKIREKTKKLEKLIQALESYIPQAEKINNNVLRIFGCFYLFDTFLIECFNCKTIVFKSYFI